MKITRQKAVAIVCLLVCIFTYFSCKKFGKDNLTESVTQRISTTTPIQQDVSINPTQKNSNVIYSSHEQKTTTTAFYTTTTITTSKKVITTTTVVQPITETTTLTTAQIVATTGIDESRMKSIIEEYVVSKGAFFDTTLTCDNSDWFTPISGYGETEESFIKLIERRIDGYLNGSLMGEEYGSINVLFKENEGCLRAFILAR